MCRAFLLLLVPSPPLARTRNYNGSALYARSIHRRRIRPPIKSWMGLARRLWSLVCARCVITREMTAAHRGYSSSAASFSMAARVLIELEISRARRPARGE